MKDCAVVTGIEWAKPGRKAEAGVPDEIVHAGIYEAILEQRLPPGTKLTEESLAEIFSVSRAVVRRALLRLAHDQVVEIRPNRGAIVAQPSPEYARHVFEARRLIETATVAKAAAAITPKQAAKLRRLIEEETRLSHQGDRQASIRLSGEFHLELAKIAGNEVYVRFLRELISLSSLIIALYEAPGVSACLHNEHVGLLDAIAARDGAAAVRAMEEHLLSCERRVNLDRDTAVVDLKRAFAGILDRRAAR